MNILALTFGDAHTASTQYRLVQFENVLEREGVRLTRVSAAQFNEWSSLNAYDLVIVQKRLFRTSLVRRIRATANRVIYDTDDAVWEPHGRPHALWTRLRTRMRIRAISRAADVCTVANEHLAEALRPWARRVEVIPMALDSAIWRPQAERASGPVRLGWAGAPPNLIYLDGISRALNEVQKLRPSVEVIVFSGQAPTWSHPVVARHYPYAPDTEAGVMRTFDIGLLPLPDNAFAAGKSPIKALQYAACGLPCVASPVGATNEIVRDGETGLVARSQDEWRDALCRLIDNEAERKRLGASARRLFMERHEHAEVSSRLLAVWREVVTSPPSLP